MSTISKRIEAKRKAPRPMERWVERLIALISYSTILAIALIFLFVAKEALPIFWQKHDMHLADLVFPNQFKGYDHKVFVWQPVAFPPKYNILPLLLGTFKVTLLAMVVAVPLGVLAAIHATSYLRLRTRAIVKPVVEMLAGFPSVVLGFFALTYLADVVQAMFGTTYRLNTLVAAIALGITVVPIVFTISDDALRAVPVELKEAAAALGARPWQSIMSVIVPTASPGIVAAIVLGFGRAIGETMIVLIASGNAPVMSLSATSGSRTLSATIAAELGEVARGDEHWRVLFLIGLVLFAVTLTLDVLGRKIVRLLTLRLEPKAIESLSPSLALEPKASELR